RCNEAKRTPRGSTQLDQILPAAHTGRVETLLVNADAQIWGRFVPQSGQTQVHEEPQTGDEDLLDRAAVETYLNSGGAVHALSQHEMPNGSPIAAVFRY